MFKRLMSFGLLCFAFDAHASITVNTTADTSGTSACSLRDAVAMVNSGSLATKIGGCTDTDTTAVIILTVGQTYTLNSELQLNNSITLQSSDTGDLSGTAGTNNPTIQAVGNHRIFSINPNGTATTAIPSVTITGVDLKGCGTSICETNGGVIFNKGTLRITTSRIYNGFANLGGGIYNENTGTVNATTVELKNNTAQQGAAIYSIVAATLIKQSLIRENTIANATQPGFAIYTQTVDPTLTSFSSQVLASTIYNNNANAINIVPGVLVDSTTIVGNQGGVTLNASVTSALANSIVGNNGTDCTFSAGDLTPINNVVYTNSCGSSAGTSTANKLLSNTGTETLMAKDASGHDWNDPKNDGSCASPPDNGLLCPYRMYTGQFTGYLLPRLVPTPGATLASSLIINKGYIGGTGQACAGDQRGQTRTLCDIGAIELVIPGGNAQSNGKDILYGDVASIDLSPVVGDGQLIPKSLCTSLFGAAPASQGGVWMDGCIVYSSAPIKGTAAFSATTDTLTYTPASNWHGFDKFMYTMATTTSFFSDANNDKTIAMTTTIVQSPPTGITSKTVGAGGVGIFAVFGLMGLALRRRLTGGQL